MANINDDYERMNNLEWRLKRIENMLGSFEKCENERAFHKITELNENLSRYASTNSNAKTILKKADDITYLTSSDFMRRLNTDKTTKLELILLEEERIRNVTDSLSKIAELAKVLDGEHFNDVPKLTEKLNTLIVNHNQIKTEHGTFTQELATFLQDYAAFVSFFCLYYSV
ncbi:unnamed protein product [Didymodactylos carnosus]|uniref:Uncharacterized protein n=1 Tax=Didymodactylos carnosus TaxID=1234261 RepID=A0A813TH67_9BILA|nr:unnamed protein product [Didymodactylos carnosus]CAF0808217.1 unnamed protein product [Didymodactylos carnosus]CAF3494547.1 unnamed protein product [Didymodactylos carnosus]CAF3593719.1 unnamed protein product [Didymodactylos carnosus]